MNAALTHTVAMVRLARAMGTATPRRRMPRQQYPHLIEVEYGRALRSVVAAARDAVAPLLAQLPYLTASEAIAMIEEARRRVAAMVPHLTQTVARFATRTVDHQATQLDAQVRAVLGIGIDMLGIARHTAVPASVHMDARTRPQAVDERVQGFITENVALIKSLGDTPLEEIEQMIARAFAAGARHETLASELIARFGVAEDRAKLIARDQIGKLNGRISADRHQRMGLTRFRWRDVGDNRVRPEHRKLAAGNAVYEYANPPSEGLPGEPILCRCHDEPIFDDVLAELDRLEAAPSPLVAPTLPPARRRAAPVELPAGYYAPGAKVVSGFPAPGNEKNRVYVFDPADIRHRLLSLPGGVQRTRIERVAQAKGQNFAPINLSQLPDGRLIVEEGRHRLIQALESGRPVAAHVGAASKHATANGLVPLTSIVPT